MDNDVGNEVRLIEDSETWFRFNSLREANAGASSVLNQAEEAENIRAGRAYEQQVHDKIFRESDDRSDALRNEKFDTMIKKFEHTRIELVACDGVVENIQMMDLVLGSEAIYTWAMNWERFPCNFGKTGNRQFNMERFESEAIAKFVELSACDTTLEEVPSDAIVECCKIAHFLQHERLLHQTTEILCSSIDTENCLSLCQFADHLNLPTLFEKSLAHMMQSLGELREETWDDLTPDLQKRVEMIQNAIQTSVHSNSRLYFGSIEEYIAIFSERVQYYKERLAQAKEEAATAKPGTNYYRDIHAKIAKQEVRVRTLTCALKEQKKLFNTKSAIRF